ncbi:tandem-95 repeat protein [Croceicoccus gelatinilyticus]|uniref:tandem-95 repeat protein n=1 Tax=Croceicoccus gelatinilyticus TaxID=2835536 RepID=UPI001BCAB76B|nr:Ig-like domain-containing protein [Croceicoccus gelatinilyticus]MBS7671670.1 tandem-95 repeat protein [Croceicoccus gelatinilyticus]
MADELSLEDIKAATNYGALDVVLVDGWLDELFTSPSARASLIELAIAGALSFDAQTDEISPYTQGTTIYVNLSTIDDLHGITKSGSYAQIPGIIIIAHELAHATAYLRDHDSDPSNDGTFSDADPDRDKFNDADYLNGLSGDQIYGGAVLFEHTVAKELDYEQLRAGYFSLWTSNDGRNGFFETGIDYTFGREIDVFRISELNISNDGGVGAVINTQGYYFDSGISRDFFFGLEGNDTVHSGDGQDILYGGAAVDHLYGENHADILLGGDGADVLDGGEGDDWINHNVSDLSDDDGDSDTLTGGGGRDIFWVGDGDIIKDPERQDKAISFLGTILTGGIETDVDSRVYRDELRDINYVKETIDGKDVLVVELEDWLEIPNAKITIENFQNGDAGIWLHQRVDPLDPETYQSPLVLDLNGDGIAISAIGEQRAYFDFQNDGFSELTAWINPEDGFLALDRDGNGVIDNGTELFGSNPYDFAEYRGGGMSRLSALDTNYDGLISVADDQFVDLQIWQDLNRDGVSDAGELFSLDDLGIVSIDLDYFKVDEVQTDGYISERSTFEWADGTLGEIADVWFRTDPRAALQRNASEISATIEAMPYIGGSGTVADLHSAMQDDPVLEEMVQRLIDLQPADFWHFGQMVDEIVLRWTGADGERPEAGFAYIDGRHLQAVENWTGDEFVQQNVDGFKSTLRTPAPQAAAALENQYRDLVSRTATRLLAQIPAASSLLPTLGYHLDAFLTVPDDFVVADFVSAANALSPTDAAEQWAFWKGVVTLAENLADDAGVDRDTLISEIDAALSAINPLMYYDALKRTVIGQDGGDTLIGSSNELDFESGDFDPTYWTLPDIGGVDWFLGGSGDDIIKTGYGKDTILFGIGSGHDKVIDNYNYNGAGLTDLSEIVQLMGGLTLADIETSLVVVDGQDVARVQISGTQDILDFYLTGIHTGLETIRLVAPDGTAAEFDVTTGTVDTISIAGTLADLEFETRAPYGTYSMRVNTLDGTEVAVIPDYYISRSDHIAFILGSTPVYLSEIDQILVSKQQTENDDRIQGTVRSDTILGLGGNDVIYADDGDDTIDGGAGADILKGGRGLDTYIFGIGSGVDTIIDPFGLNAVEFGAGIALTDLQFSYGGTGDDLVIRIAGTQDQLVIKGEFPGGNYGIETFTFDDSSSLSRADVLALMPDRGLDLFSPLVTGTDGQEIIGAVGDLTIAAGGGGRDTYVFNRGDGLMWIGDADIDDWDPTKPDILEFGEGITQDDLTFRMLSTDTSGFWLASGNAVEIGIKGTDDKVLIHQFSPYWYHNSTSVTARSVALDTIRFADGLEMDLDTIFGALQQGTDGRDLIWGWLEGSVLDGGYGDDTYVVVNWSRQLDDVSVRFGADSGHDYISGMGTSTSEDHKVLLDPGITLSDISFELGRQSRGQMEVTLTLNNADASLRLGNIAENFSLVFDDGLILNAFDIAQIDAADWVAGEQELFVIPSEDRLPDRTADTVQDFVIDMTGFAGDKLLDLRAGQATYSGYNYPQNVILDLPAGVNATDLAFRYDFYSHELEGDFDTFYRSATIVIDLPDGSSLRLLNGIGGDPTQNYNLEFRDATGGVLSLDDIAIALTNAGANYGTTADETFTNRPQDDVFVLQTSPVSNDVVEFGFGSGRDYVVGPASLKLATGVSVSDVHIEIRNTDFSLDPTAGNYIGRLDTNFALGASISLVGTDDSITFDRVQDLQQIEFADGTVWTWDNVNLASAMLQGTTGDDQLLWYNPVPWWNQTDAQAPIDPGAGDDIILDASIEFHRGSGHDRFFGQGSIYFTDVQDTSELEFRNIPTYNADDRWYDDATPETQGRYNKWAYQTVITYKDTGDTVTIDGTAKLFLQDGTRFFAWEDPFTNRDDYIDDIGGLEGWFDLAGGGYDIIKGNYGATYYYFGYGDGQHTLMENDVWEIGNQNKLDFKPGITLDNITLSVDREGNITLGLAGSDDYVVIPSLSHRAFRPAIEWLGFEEDGTTHALADLVAPLMVATDGDDVIFEIADYETRWVDRVSGLFDGGAGDDFLAGGAGSDFYVFGRGYGQDTIYEKSAMPLWFEITAVEDYPWSFPESEIDVLTFEPDIALTDLKFVRGGTTGDDLIIEIVDTGDRVTIIDQFAPLDLTGESLYDYYNYREWDIDDLTGDGRIDAFDLEYYVLRYIASSPEGIEAIRFADNVELTLDQIVSRIEGTDNSGDNIYYADKYGGTLDGGAGNDELHGSSEDDDFIFARGYGEDSITDTGGYDIVRFGEGVRQEWTHFSRTGDDNLDLLIEIDGPERLTLTIDGQFSQAPGVVEEFSYLSGEYLTWIDVQNIILTQERTSRDDDIVGFLTDDVIRGGDGHDILTGIGGNDTLYGERGRDTAVFRGAESEYSIEYLGDHIVVTDLIANRDGTDTLYGIEELYFQGSDETVVAVTDPGAPTPTDLQFNGTEDLRLTIAVADIYASVAGLDGGPFELVSVGGATDGRVWINLDGDVVFEPSADFFGDASFVTVFENAEGTQGSGVVSVSVASTPDAPRLTSAIGQVVADEDTPLDWQIPDGTFVDPDGDALTYSATLSSGASLPTWLSLVDGHLVGTPPQDFNGSYDIRLTASDGNESVSDDFLLVVRNVNDAPVAGATLGTVNVLDGEVFELQLPGDLFTDVDGDPLFFGLQYQDGTAAPGWLYVTDGILGGSVPDGLSGSLSLTLLASDGEYIASQDFSLNVSVSNQAPTIGTVIADVTIDEDNPVDIAIPVDAFIDPDGDPLTLTATFDDGSVLPGWLTFDGYDLSGTPPTDENGSWSILVSASDGELSASQQFDLVINPVNDAPTATDDGVFVSMGGNALVILTSDLLVNDIDVDGDALSLVSVGNAVDGTVAIDQSGNVVYTAYVGFEGTDQFSYTITDGSITATANVTVVIEDPYAGWYQGTEGPDTIFGNNATTNYIFGRAGDDHIKGGGLVDYLAGGDGDDQIQGLQDDDHIWGNGGDDHIVGGPGIDTAYYSGFIEEYTFSTSGGELFVEAIHDGSNEALDDGQDGLTSIERLTFRGNETIGVSSPIILDLAGDGIETLSASESDAKFDLDSDGLADDTSWVGSGDGFLYLDRNDDGTLTNVGEISFIDDVPDATSDLGGLRAYDTNGDGLLSVLDERFTDFAVWQDIDGDGAVDVDETFSLVDLSIASFDLTGTAVSSTTQLGEVAVLNTGRYQLGDGTERGFIDAALTYFSAATNLPEFEPEKVTIGRGRYRWAMAGRFTDETGPNTIAEYFGKSYGMLSPIVLDLDGNGIGLQHRSRTSARFDMDGNGVRDDTGWLSAGDAFLVIDRNNDGLITHASELSLASELPDAQSALAGLAALDSNEDGKIDASDARFNELRLWVDANSDGITDAGELRTLEEIGIASLDLTSQVTSDRDKLDGNAVLASASFTWENGDIGDMADVSLGYRPSKGAALRRSGRFAAIFERLSSNSEQVDLDNELGGPATALDRLLEAMEADFEMSVDTSDMAGSDLNMQSRALLPARRQPLVAAIEANDNPMSARLALIRQEIAAFNGSGVAEMQEIRRLHVAGTDWFA